MAIDSSPANSRHIFFELPPNIVSTNYLVCFLFQLITSSKLFETVCARASGRNKKSCLPREGSSLSSLAGVNLVEHLPRVRTDSNKDTVCILAAILWKSGRLYYNGTSGQNPTVPDTALVKKTGMEV